MSASKRLTARKSFFFIIIGLVAFGAYLYFFIGFNSIAEVLKQVNSSQYAFFYSLACVCILVANFFWSSSWRVVLNSLHVKISVKNAYFYFWTGYFVDLVIPCETVCGEVTRLYLVHKETQDNYGAIAAGGITNRIVAYIIITCGLYTSTLLVFLRGSIPAFALNFLLLIVVGDSIYLFVLLYLAFEERAAEKLAGIGIRILKKLRPKKYGADGLTESTRESLAVFYQGFKTFRENPRCLTKPFIFQILSFVFNLSVYFLVFYALGIRTMYIDFFIVVFFVSGALQDISASFSVGTLDILLATFFILYGISPAKSGVAALVLRTVTFWFPLLVGYVIAQIIGARNVLAPQTQEKMRETTRTPQPTIQPPIRAERSSPHFPIERITKTDKNSFFIQEGV